MIARDGFPQVIVSRSTGWGSELSESTHTRDMSLAARRWRGIVLVIMLVGAAGVLIRLDGGAVRAVAAQAPDPACRFMYDDGPYHDISSTCVELVWEDIPAPEAVPALGGLAFAPDGTLYMARTALGEVWSLRDADGDRFMDAPVRVTENLGLPVALTWHDDALYVLTVEGVIRLDDPGADGAFGARAVIVPDLGVESGFWPGNLAFGPDGRLYVSVGANCRDCVGVAKIVPGEVRSYAPDGTDRRVEATGLRNPADFAWHPISGQVWVVDGARVIDPAANDGPPDELMRVWESGMDFGFPACVGMGDADPVLGADDPAACADTFGPEFVFPYQSNPSGIAFALDTPYPDWYQGLIVAFRGSWNLPEPAGYALGVVPFADDHPSGALQLIAPAFIPGQELATLPEYSLTGRGLYPNRPVDVVVSPDGWLYLSLEQGQILRFRPRIPEDRRTQ